DMSLIFLCYPLRLATATPYLHSFPTRRSSDLGLPKCRPSLCPYIKTRGLLATGREVAPFPSRFGRTGKPGLSSLCAQAAPYPPLFRTRGPLRLPARPVLHRPLGWVKGSPVMQYCRLHPVPRLCRINEDHNRICRRVPGSNRAGRVLVPYASRATNGPLSGRPSSFFWFIWSIPLAGLVPAAANNTFPVGDPECMFALLRAVLLFLH